MNINVHVYGGRKKVKDTAGYTEQISFKESQYNQLSVGKTYKTGSGRRFIVISKGMSQKSSASYSGSDYVVTVRWLD